MRAYRSGIGGENNDKQDMLGLGHDNEWDRSEQIRSLRLSNLVMQLLERIFSRLC